MVSLDLIMHQEHHGLPFEDREVDSADDIREVNRSKYASKSLSEPLAPIHNIKRKGTNPS